MSILPFKSIWLSRDLNKIRILPFDIIILFSFGNGKELLNYIHKKTKHKIIYWYWTSVNISGVNPSIIKNDFCDIWTFDRKDALQYCMKLNTQFYCFENLKRVDLSDRTKYDIFFCGTEKDRLNELIEYEKIFTTKGLKTYFHIVKSNFKFKSSSVFAYKEPISYDNCLSIVNESKCVLDIVSNTQTGMTLRPLEALYFKKKLITNDKNIIKEKIYNKNNIFVIGIDDLCDITNFVNSEFDDTNYESLINYYSILSWINRFKEGAQI